MRSVEELVAHGDLSQNPLGRRWTDGLFTGNGNVSALLSGEQELEWTINKVDVYQGFPFDIPFVHHDEIMRRVESGEIHDTHFMDAREKERNAPPKTRHSVTAALLRLKSFHYFGWAIPTLPLLTGEVSLYHAAISAEYRHDTRRAGVLSFTPRDTNALCIRLEDKAQYTKASLYAKESVYTWELFRPEDGGLELPTFHMDGNTVSFVQKFERENEHWAVALKLIPADGSAIHPLTTEGCVCAVQTVGDVTAFLTVRTSRDGTDPYLEAKAECDALAKQGFDALYQKHCAWWARFWEQSGMELTSEPELERRVLFAQYTMGCNFAKTPMPGLSGMAYGPLNALYPGCYAPYYTHDQNVQIALMGALPLGYGYMAEVMADTYRECLPVLRAHTKNIHGTEGICLPLCMLQNGYSHGGEYRYTLCGSAYSGMIMVMAWRYTRDERALREKFYPLLKEFIRFYLSIMHKGADDIYHLDWTVPPEIFTLTRDDCCTMSLLKPCLETAVEVSERWKADTTEAALWRDVLAHYPPVSRRSDGAFWCGPDISEEHYMYGGHLFYPYFPSEVDCDDDAARKTLDWWQVNSHEMDEYDDPGCGWSSFNAGVVRQRTGRGENFSAVFDFLRLFAKPNGLFHHNAINLDKIGVCSPDAKRLVPPVIEGTSAILFMTAEALLQCHHGETLLFPCVPADFTGSFANLRTTQGVSVTAAMEAGCVTSCNVTAAVDTPLVLCLPDGRRFEQNLCAGETAAFV